MIPSISSSSKDSMWSEGSSSDEDGEHTLEIIMLFSFCTSRLPSAPAGVRIRRRTVEGGFDVSPLSWVRSISVKVEHVLLRLTGPVSQMELVAFSRKFSDFADLSGAAV